MNGVVRILGHAFNVKQGSARAKCSCCLRSTPEEGLVDGKVPPCVRLSQNGQFAKLPRRYDGWALLSELRLKWSAP